MRESQDRHLKIPQLLQLQQNSSLACHCYIQPVMLNILRPLHIFVCISLAVQRRTLSLGLSSVLWG